MENAPTLKSKSKRTKHKISAKDFWRLALITIWTIAILYAVEYAFAYLMLWIFGAEKLSTPVMSTLYTALTYAVTLILVILIPQKFIKKWRTNRDELGLSGLPTWTDIGLAPIGLIAAYLLGLILQMLFSFLPWFNATEAQNVGFNNIFLFSDRLLAFFALVIVAPIAEEIIFRGWLYGKLRTKLNMPIAMLIVSVLFGIVHGQWNVGVTVFAMSLVMCFLREITGTIYSGIILHILKNAVAFILLYVIVM